MVDPVTTRLWTYRILFIGLTFIIIFLHLLPLKTATVRFAAPDLLVALIAAWVLRRPDYVPVISVIIVMLVADVFFQRPPGLMAALVLVATEFFRSRSHLVQEFPFLLEWSIFTIVIGAVYLVYGIMLMAVAVEPPSVTLAALQLLATMVAYPVVVVATKYVFRVDWISPGDLEHQRMRA